MQAERPPPYRHHENSTGRAWAGQRMRAWPGCVKARRWRCSPCPACCCSRAAWHGCWLPGRPRGSCGSPGTVLGLVFAVSWVAGAIRRRQPSVDVIAVLALAGALAVGEPFAGAVITVMLASGQLLEARASARARRELSLLAGRAPRTARRRVGGGVVEVPVDDVVPGDRLLVGAGGIVPVDGRLLSPAVLDESALTGESRLAERIAGEDVRSGVVNAGQPIELVATAAAAESTYAGVVRLVEQAPGFVGAVRPRRRPVRRPVCPAYARPRGSGLGAQRGPGPRRRGAGGRDAVPAAARGPDRDHVRPVPRRAHRRRRQGRRRPRTPGRRAGDALRQDWHADPGATGAGRRRHGGRPDGRG